MKRLLKKTLINLLSLVKAYPTSMTEKKDILSLIESLHPVSTDKNLIRLGPKGDGGYLVPEELQNIIACFSPGVERLSKFEKDCAEMGIECFLADKSVDKPSESHNLFHFTKKFIGAINNEDFITLEEWVASSLSGRQGDLLLQMDIEGYEYETILSTSESLLNRFRIIIVEFHWLDMLWSKPFFLTASASFRKVLQTHTCVHIHPNNQRGVIKKNGIEIPKLAEFTFLRNDRITNRENARQFPHPLDADNVDNKSVILPYCWYRK